LLLQDSRLQVAQPRADATHLLLARPAARLAAPSLWMTRLHDTTELATTRGPRTIRS
jgi:hypothetical protein